MTQNYCFAQSEAVVASTKAIYSCWYVQKQNFINNPQNTQPSNNKIKIITQLIPPKKKKNKKEAIDHNQGQPYS